MLKIGVYSTKIGVYNSAKKKVLSQSQLRPESPKSSPKFLVEISHTEKKKGITCNETESSKRVTDHSRVINALHSVIITDFLVGIVVQS